MKEITPPEGYNLSDTVYKVTVADKTDDSQNTVIVINGDSDENSVQSICNIRTSSEGIEVEKRWKGNTPADGTEIQYKLYQKASKTQIGKMSIDITALGYGKPDWNQGFYFSNDDLTGAKDKIKPGSVIDIIITTTSNGWSFDTLNETTEITSNQTILSDELKSIESSNYQRTIRIQVTDEDASSITLSGQLESCRGNGQDGDNYKPTITAKLVSEPEGDVNEVISLVGTVTLGKDTVSAVIESDFEELTPAVTVGKGSGDWTSVIKNLPELVTDEDYITEYTYYAEEVEDTIPQGFILEGITPASAVPGDTITIVNAADTPETISITVKKTDNVPDSTNYLKGAVFRLQYRSDSEASWTNAESTIVQELDEDSLFIVPEEGITLTGLVDGQYRLQEITPPEGYVITNSSPIVFTVSGGEITDTNGTMTGVGYNAASGSNAAEFTVPNEPGVELPATGGPGIGVFYFLGILHIAFACILLRKEKVL